MKRGSLLSVATGAALVLGVKAQAQTTVYTESFDNALNTYGTQYSWTDSGMTETYTESQLAGFTLSGQTGSTQRMGVMNPMNNKFTDTLPSPANGNQTAYMSLNNQASPGRTLVITSNVGTVGNLAANLDYTLKVAVGNNLLADSGTAPNAVASVPNLYRIELLVDGVSKANTVVNGSAIASGAFNDATVTYRSPVSGTEIGKAMQIKMTAEWTTAFDYGQAYVDNLRLTSAPVPEPAGLSLLALGGLGLIRRRRA